MQCWNFDILLSSHYSLISSLKHVETGMGQRHVYRCATSLSLINWIKNIMICRLTKLCAWSMMYNIITPLQTLKDTLGDHTSWSFLTPKPMWMSSFSFKLASYFYKWLMPSSLNENNDCNMFRFGVSNYYRSTCTVTKGIISSCEHWSGNMKWREASQPTGEPKGEGSDPFHFQRLVWQTDAINTWNLQLLHQHMKSPHSFLPQASHFNIQQADPGLHSPPFKVFVFYCLISLIKCTSSFSVSIHFVAYLRMCGLRAWVYLMFLSSQQM